MTICDKQKCPQSSFNKFKNQILKFDDDHIKKLRQKHQIKIKLADKIYSIEITHEIRLTGGKERLLIAHLPDTGNAKHPLYVAVYYAENGLHVQANTKALKDSLKTPIQITLAKESNANLATVPRLS